MKKKTYMVTVETSDYDADLLEQHMPERMIRNQFAGTAIRIESISEPPQPKRRVRRRTAEEAAEAQAAYDDEWPQLQDPWWEDR